MLFADGEEPLLALHHVHKAHRHTDDQCGPQAAFNLFCDRQQSRGRVADGEDGPGMLLRCLFHGRDGPGGASLFCGGGHLGVSHITAGRAAQLLQTGLGDAGQRHVRIGHDDGPGVEGLDGLLHRAGSEVEIPRIVEVGGGVDDPLDHGFVLGRRGQAHHFQFFGDDVEARPLNVGGQMMLRRQYSIPFRAFIPFW